MKKKIVALSLVVAMVVMNSVVALGGTMTSSDGASNNWSSSDGTKLDQDVKVKFINAETAKYSVDITWGSMVFNYTQGDWKPDTHTYASETWTVGAQTDNNIEVVNHSNKKVEVSMTATLNDNAQGTINNLSGEFKDILSEDTIGETVTCLNPITTPTMGATTLARGALNKPGLAASCKQELNIKGTVELAGHSAGAEAKVGAITITLEP